MNKIFNVVWSHTKERWIVVSEKVKSNGGVPKSPLRSLAVLVALLAAGDPAYALDSAALPTGGQVTSGSGSIAVSGSQMKVNQSTQQMIANWNTFNIGSGAGVQFVQPNAAAAALNRINDQNPSQIMGSLSSNGKVFLLNPVGIIFGSTARVDVGSLVATSLNMLDSDFLAGKYKFSGTGNTASIVNQGAIKAMDGGVVALVAPKVTNEGSITANGGSAVLAAGNKVSLDFQGDGLISYTVDEGAVNALVENKGLVKADGGLVVMTAKAADALMQSTVNSSGVIEALTVQEKAGRIILDAAEGTMLLSGTLDASAPNGGDGGFVETSGSQVRIEDTAKVTTLAPEGISGNWLIDPINFTIWSGNGGQDISGIGADTLSSNLVNSNIEIRTSRSTGGNGDIIVGGEVFWNAGTTLTLGAHGNIFVNHDITSSLGALVLEYGLGARAEGNSSFYSLNDGAQINLPGGQSFTTIQGYDGEEHIYLVINIPGSAGRIAQTDLQGISTSDGFDYYALGSNIDASDTSNWNDDGAGNYAGFAPISSFNGIFEGLGHTISNLYINRPNEGNIGLFGSVNSGSIVRNVSLTSVNISGGDAVGALAGYNAGTLENSFATGVVTGDSDTGGLVGYNAGGLIEHSGFGVINSTVIVESLGNNVLARVTGNSDTGGLVGHNDGGDIAGSRVGIINVEGQSLDLSVSGWSNTGGLVGYNNGGTITESGIDGKGSEVKGGVNGNNNTGGLVGSNDGGDIAGSYAKAPVTGKGTVGGLVGDNDGGAVTDSYAEGGVTVEVTNTLMSEGTGSNSSILYVGGLIGRNNEGAITRSYATGNVDVTVENALKNFESYNDSRLYTGGLIGENVRGALAESYAQGNVTVKVTNDVSSGSYSQNTSYTYTGGLAGKNDGGAITNSYAIGEVSVTALNNVGSEGSSDNYNDDYTGGLVGYNDGADIRNSYYEQGSVKLMVSGEDSTDDYTGGLAGYNINSDISLSHATGNVSGGKYDTGGLVGHNENATVSYSYASGAVDGSERVGGLVGHNDTGGFITDSYATGSVTGNYRTGGLVGWQEDGSIIKSYATGSVSGDDRIGGLVGYNEASDAGTGVGSITNSYATGSVMGNNHTGGLVGYNDYGRIDNSFATGSLKGVDRTGGLIGDNYGNVSNSYATGNVVGSGVKTGGLIGVNHIGDVNSSYATGNVRGGDDYTGGLIGKSSDAAITNSYASGEVTGSHEYTGGLVGYNYEGAISNSYATGDVKGDGDQGHTAGLVGYNYEGAITNSFATGNVSDEGSDGCVAGLVGHNYHGSIENSYATGSVVGGDNYNGGLVGYNVYGSITDSYATGNVSGSDFTGGLVGRNTGSIASSYASGSVYGEDDIDGVGVGGLVGRNSSSGSITNSYATGSVHGSDYNVGGLVGKNYGSVVNSYATGDVAGEGDVGGLVGDNYGSIDKSYSTGYVSANTEHSGGLVGWSEEGDVYNSFWNVSTSGHFYGDSAGGSGKNSEEMQTASTYSGWDASVWNIANGSYPTLKVFSPDVNNFVPTTDNSWTTIGNWSAYHIPTIFETANIGNYTVTISSNVLVHELISNAGKASGSKLVFTGATVSSLSIGENDHVTVNSELDYGISGKLNLTGASEYSRTGGGNLLELNLNGTDYTVIQRLGGPVDLRYSDGFYVLGLDIDFSSAVDFAPVEGFTGMFDGLGHSINNLTITDWSNTNVGFFRTLDHDATVQNFGAGCPFCSGWWKL